jgi:hypothetical protein
MMGSLRAGGEGDRAGSSAVACVSPRRVHGATVGSQSNKCQSHVQRNYWHSKKSSIHNCSPSKYSDHRSESPRTDTENVRRVSHWPNNRVLPFWISADSTCANFTAAIRPATTAKALRILRPILAKLQENAGRCIFSQTYDSRLDREKSRFAAGCKTGQQIPKRSITRSITRDVGRPTGKKGHANSDISAAGDSPLLHLRPS